MRKPKLRELGEAIKVLVTGPYTAPFPKQLTVPPESFRGKPEFDPDVCIGCGACSEVCPSKSIEIIDDTDSATRRLVLHLDRCNFCGQCHAYCTTGDGIDYTAEYDLAGMTRDDMTVSVEKELALCEHCGAAVATKDHLRWIAHRLGTLAYANPTLILASLKELEQTGDIPAREHHRQPGRDDLFRVLCPECRRRMFLAEEWGAT